MKNNQTLRVLHVDDDVGFLEVAKQILELEGKFEVETALSVDDAFLKLADGGFDVVVSDYEMPMKNGLDFLKELKEKNVEVPFILFTGKGREEVAIKALNLGANYYLNKHGSTETVYGELAHSISSVGERKRVDEELKQKREILENVIENVGAGLTIINKDYRIIWANRMLKAVGAAEGKTCYSTYNKLNHVCPDCGVKKIFEESAASDIHEYSTTNANGEYVCVELIVNPIKDSAGNVIAAMELAVPITERKKAEEQLKESEERFRQLFTNMPSAVAVYSAVDGGVDFVFKDFNDAAERIEKVSRNEVIGKHVTEVFPGVKDFGLFDVLCRVYRTGTPEFFPIGLYHDEREPEAWRENWVYKLPNGDIVAIYNDVTERQKVRKELESMARFPMENANPVFRISSDGQVLYANPASHKLKKETSLETGGLAPETWRTQVAIALSSKEPLIFEEEHDGRIFQFNVAPVTSEGYANLYAIDISEHRNMEKALKENEKRLQAIVLNAPIGIATSDKNSRFLSANKEFCKILGYTENELLKLTFKDITHPEDLDESSTKMNDLRAGKISFFNIKKRYLKKDGSIMIGQVTVNAIRDQKGKACLFIAELEDITERMQQEARLRESKQKFELLFAKNPEAIVLVGKDMLVKEVNPAFTRLFGFSNKELEKTLLPDLVVPDNLKQDAEELREKAKAGRVKVETVRKRKDGSEVHVALSIEPIIEQNKFAGFIVVYKDISEIIQAKESLEKALQETQVLNEKLNVIGGLTRHDVRNKLHGIVGLTYLLGKKLGENAEVASVVERINLFVEQSVAILEFSGAYEKIGIEPLKMVNAEECFNEACALFSEECKGKAVNELQGLNVLADSLLQKVFYNLIDNSLRHGEKVTCIRAYFKSEPDEVRLIYEDDGVGISEEDKKRLFTEGFTKGKGSGYGLFMIQKLMEVYGWTIQENGKQGEGVRFTIAIPQDSTRGR